MNRSEINQHIRNAIDFFRSMNFHLPRWAYWRPEDWKGQYDKCSEIIDHELGWDITDFASGHFHKTGLILFTLRNGSLATDDKPYCEKIMVVGESQVTPWHFHWHKTEDIINRAGGELVIELFRSTDNEAFSDKSVSTMIDGVKTTIQAGGKIVLKAGESICLKPGIYHRFYGAPGKGHVLVGEVSMVNDDKKDNRFYEALGRFPEICADESPLHLLVSDYKSFI